MAYLCKGELQNDTEMKINNMMIAAFVTLMVSLLSACEADFENGNKDKFNQLPDTPAAEEENTFKTYTISHPSLMHTDDDFTRVANYIRAGKQPWTDAWEYLKGIEFTKLDNSFTSDAPTTLSATLTSRDSGKATSRPLSNPGFQPIISDCAGA